MWVNCNPASSHNSSFSRALAGTVAGEMTGVLETASATRYLAIRGAVCNSSAKCCFQFFAWPVVPCPAEFSLIGRMT